MFERYRWPIVSPDRDEVNIGLRAAVDEVF
jgi:hypothetical protein